MHCDLMLGFLKFWMIMDQNVNNGCLDAKTREHFHLDFSLIHILLIFFSNHKYGLLLLFRDNKKAISLWDYCNGLLNDPTALILACL